MTYQLISPDRMELRPHRSLPLRGFAVVILTFFAFITIPLAAMVGTVLLWGLLPFALMAIGALWWGLRRSYRDGDILEVLEIVGDDLILTRTNPDGSTQDWRCNLHWVRVTNHETGGPVPHYVTLNGNGREVEIGAFLSEEERPALYADLQRLISARR
jgi:uncharacterized membrane protein